MRKEGPRLLIVPADAGAPEDSGMETRGDDELMLLARGGLGDAFDLLVRRYQPQVLRMAARHLGRSALPADVAQNAFLAVYRALPRYQARDRFAAYLFRTVLNECRMAQRGARLRARFTSRFEDEAGAPGAAGPAGVATPALSAEAMVLAREQERDVEAAVAKLSDKLRDVVSLRYGAGLGYDEIAETLQLPVGTVKRRLFTALEKLRSRLEDP